MADTLIDNADPHNAIFFDNPVPNPYWLSLKVVMSPNPDQVAAGANTTNVTVTWTEAGVFTENSVAFDLYISNEDPSLPMVHLTTGGVGTLDAIASAQTVPQTQMGQPPVPIPVTWNTASFPNLGTGHRCLLARVYPPFDLAGNFPPNEDLTTFPSDDIHYAQHNCTVLAGGSGHMHVPIRNGNWLEEPQLVALQAVPDLNPTRTVLDAVLPGLRQIPAFKQIATTPLRRVDFDLSAFKSSHDSLLDKIEDWIERKVLKIFEDLEGKCHGAGGTSTRVVLPPKHFAKLNFIADLSGSNPGDAHIYHVSQVNGKGEPYGGLTVAMVVT